MTDNVEAVKAEEPAINPLEKSIDITVSAAELNAGIEAELKRAAKKAKMPGFRVGHVPMSHVRAMYGQDAYVNTLNRLIDAEYRKAVEEQKLNVCGQADCKAKETKEGEDLQFTLTVEVYPEITTPDFSAMELKRYTSPATDAEVAKTIDIIAKQRATFEKEEGREAAAEDRVTINFKGTKDGEAFQGGSAEGFSFVLAQGRMLPDFEAAVTGMKAGDKKSFNLTFPENYGNAELAGKEVVFEVECTNVEKPIYPAIDEAFLKTLGLDSVEALNTEVRGNLEREVKARLLARTKAGVIDAVLKACEFAVPKALIADEQKRMAEQFARDTAARSGANLKDVKPLPAELFAEPAARSVRLGMMFSHIVAENKIEVTREDMEAHVRELAAAYEQPEEMVKFMLQDPNQANQVANVVVENKVVDLILSKAKTSEEVVAFDNLMGQQPA